MIKLATHKKKFKPKYISSNKNEILQLLEWECHDPWKEIKNSKRSYLIELLSQLVNEFSKLKWQSYEGGLGVRFYPLGSPLVTPHPAPHMWESGCIWISWMWLGNKLLERYLMCDSTKKNFF
jgi:hypothetical protein